MDLDIMTEYPQWFSWSAKALAAAAEAFRLVITRSSMPRSPLAIRGSKISTMRCEVGPNQTADAKRDGARFEHIDAKIR
jgi:hypothetical protein